MPFSPVHNAPIARINFKIAGMVRILLTEILCCFGYKIIIQRERNATCGFFSDTDIEICDWSLRGHSRSEDRSMLNVCHGSPTVSYILEDDLLRNPSSRKCWKITPSVSLNRLLP